MSWTTDDFDYDLPPALIAQHPLPRRDGGRLLRLDRASGAIRHGHVVELPELLPAGTLLVVNDSRVVPARLRARRESGGQVELLLIEPAEEGAAWRCMVRSSKRLRRGECLQLCRADGADAGENIEVLSDAADGRCTVQLAEGTIQRWGSVPLPPYINRLPDASDRERYQTLFATQDGSVAAPTAGLHFSAELREQLAARDIVIRTLTLHVGPGTFTPVRTDDPTQHQLDAERYEVASETADAIADARRQGRPVVAVGTTVVRALESTGGRAGKGRTELLILPGYRFRAIDGLLSNFHLPRSSLLMLVCAFGGYEHVLAAYRQAVGERYRFYSYGDAMLLL